MKIRINFLGMLSNHTGVESVEFDMSDDADYGDLLDMIADRFGGKLPKSLWNAERKEFRKPINAIGSNGDIEERGARLKGHDEIHFLMPVSGGR